MDEEQQISVLGIVLGLVRNANQEGIVILSKEIILDDIHIFKVCPVILRVGPKSHRASVRTGSGVYMSEESTEGMHSSKKTYSKSGI
jgi:hypothetical protein